MASILNLSTDMLVKIAGHLGSFSDINNFARTSHYCYGMLNRYLYTTAGASAGINLYDSGLIWVVEHKRMETLKHFIDVGALAGPNCACQLETLLELSTDYYADIDMVKALFNYGVTLLADFHLHCERALGKAMKADRYEMIEFFLSNGVKSQGLSENLASVIDIAIQRDGGKLITLLSSHGVDFTQLGPRNSTALHIAAKSGKLGSVDALLQIGLDPNTTDDDGIAPIHYLGAFCHIVGGRSNNLSKVLLSYGADPHLKDQHGFTPLWIASYAGDKKQLAILLKHGVNPNGFDREGNPEPHIPLEEFKRIADKYRRQWPVRIREPPERSCCTPLCVAAYYGDYPAARELLRCGADPNHADPNGELPLHLAILSKKRNLVEQLINHGSSLTVKDCHGRAPFELALVQGGHDVVEALFEGGASVDSLCSEGIDPIFRALEYGHSCCEKLLPSGIAHTTYQKGIFRLRKRWPWPLPRSSGPEPHECERVLKLFLQHGSKLDSRDEQGRTVLHQTAFQLCMGGIKFLLEQGADPMSKDSFGQIPLHMACNIQPGDGDEGFEALLLAGSDPNCKDINGDTPLHLAARSGSPDSVCFLRLNSQADFTARNNRGNTPLHEAVAAGIETTDWQKDTIIELRKGNNDLTLTNNDGETVLDLALQYPEDSHFDFILDALSCGLTEESEIVDDGDLDKATRFNMEAQGIC